MGLRQAKGGEGAQLQIRLGQKLERPAGKRDCAVRLSLQVSVPGSGCCDASQENLAEGLVRARPQILIARDLLAACGPLASVTSRPSLTNLLKILPRFSAPVARSRRPEHEHDLSPECYPREKLFVQDHHQRPARDVASMRSPPAFGTFRREPEPLSQTPTRAGALWLSLVRRGSPLPSTSL